MPDPRGRREGSGRNRLARTDRPTDVQSTFASQFKEHDSTFQRYEHLRGLPRGDEALTMLRKVASMVKPIMRKRGWHVPILAEFLPRESNLLGLNWNQGEKICIRLRYHNNPDLFLHIDQVTDTMLHELSHIVWGEHDDRFHRLWEELRDEMMTLQMKGYTGEGFLSTGHRLGGSGRAPPPQHEIRRLAKESAEKRRQQNTLTKGSGQRLGGVPLHRQGRDVRNVIVDQIEKRNASNAINRGCASGRSDATEISNQAANNVFRTKAEEDDANDRAIAQALFELWEEEEERKLTGTFLAAPTDGGLAWHPDGGLYDPGTESLPQTTGSNSSRPNKASKPPGAFSNPLPGGGLAWHPDGGLYDASTETRPQPNGNLQSQPSEEEQMEWAMQDSTRSTSQNLFEQAALNSYNRTNSAPPIPTDSRPSPVSSASSSRPSFRDSPVSPLAPEQGANIPRKPINRNATRSSATSNHSILSRLEQTTASPIIDISEPFDPSAVPPEQWTCDVCTCINPLQFLQCDACGTERPQSIGIGNRGPRPRPQPRPAVSAPSIQDESMGWMCTNCMAFMEHRWWTCSACGKMKETS